MRSKNFCKKKKKKRDGEKMTFMTGLSVVAAAALTDVAEVGVEAREKERRV